nr:hypothetical protein [Tanacetum cinerariifolium]
MDDNSNTYPYGGKMPREVKVTPHQGENKKKKRNDHVLGYACLDPLDMVKNRTNTGSCISTDGKNTSTFISNDGTYTSTYISTHGMSNRSEVTDVPITITGSNILSGNNIPRGTTIASTSEPGTIPHGTSSPIGTRKVDSGFNTFVDGAIGAVVDVGAAFTSPFSSTEVVDSVLRDGTWMIRGVPIFLNKWSPFVSLLKEDLSCVPVWVKFHDVLLVAYTPDELSLTATKIGNPLMLDSYTNFMCFESYGRSDYTRILIEINDCKGFSSNLVMVASIYDGPSYMKKTIHVEYEWKSPRYSMCLIFGHLVDDCPKAPKRVVNKVDKGIGRSFGADDEGFTEVKKKNSSGVSPKMVLSVGKKNVSTLGNSSKMSSKPIDVTSGNENIVNEDMDSGNKASTPDDDDGNPLKMVEYLGDHDSEDEVATIDNKMASFFGFKTVWVGYDTNSLMEQ